MNIDRNKKIPDGTKFVRLNDVLNLLCEGCLEDCYDPNLMCDFLDEWHVFCDWIKTLPYSELIIGPCLEDVPICNEIMNEAKHRVEREDD